MQEEMKDHAKSHRHGSRDDTRQRKLGNRNNKERSSQVIAHVRKEKEAFFFGSETPPGHNDERKKPRGGCHLVGAGSLDMTGLLALVADSLTAGLGRALTGEMANLAT